MNEFEVYKEHIQYTHNAYCKVVIRHAYYDAYRLIMARWKKEISFDYLTDEKFYPFGTTDIYFAEPEQTEESFFTSCGQTVLLHDPVLAAALLRLPPFKQEMIYLYYFCALTQKEIAESFGRKRSNTGQHIRNALRQLYEEMEVLGYERPTSPL